MTKILNFLMIFILILNCSIAWSFSSTQIVKSAKSQIGKTLYYDPAYTQLKYPMGDVSLVKGVCTDVVIRALREQGLDLQQMIHEDMKKNFKSYPQKWSLKGPDKNIDHRRVPNIATYFKRQGYEIKNADFQAGDIVTWDLGHGLAHVGIVSDRTDFFNKAPLIIHNIGSGTQENNILYQYKITGHFRIKNN